MHQPPLCQASSSLISVSEDLHLFFVLALFRRYFQYLFLLLLGQLPHDFMVFL